MPRGRRSHGRDSHASPADILIPDKLYFRIGEVGELTKTKPYVLRYWETEFPSLKPLKSRSGHRLYRRKDVEMVVQIKSLLYGRGFTIEGARRHLENAIVPDNEHASRAGLDGMQLRAIRRELQAILTTLSQKC